MFTTKTMALGVYIIFFVTSIDFDIADNTKDYII